MESELGPKYASDIILSQKNKIYTVANERSITFVKVFRYEVSLASQDRIGRSKAGSLVDDRSGISSKRVERRNTIEDRNNRDCYKVYCHSQGRRG
jgi:hypothetical protein